MSELSAETKKIVGEIATHLIGRVFDVATKWAHEIVSNLAPEVDRLTEKANRKVLPSDSEERRVKVMRELVEELDELLDNVEVHVTVGDRTFTVRGFRP